MFTAMMSGCTRSSLKPLNKLRTRSGRPRPQMLAAALRVPTSAATRRFCICARTSKAYAQAAEVWRRDMMIELKFAVFFVSCGSTSAWAICVARVNADTTALQQMSSGWTRVCRASWRIASDVGHAAPVRQAVRTAAKAPTSARRCFRMSKCTRRASCQCCARVNLDTAQL